MHTRRLHTLLADWTVSMVTITGFCSLCYRKVVSGSVRECFREWFLVQRLQKKAFGTIAACIRFRTRTVASSSLWKSFSLWKWNCDGKYDVTELQLLIKISKIILRFHRLAFHWGWRNPIVQFRGSEEKHFKCISRPHTPNKQTHNNRGHFTSYYMEIVFRVGSLSFGGVERLCKSPGQHDW